ncbi:DUF4253 domain-containing protein [Streptomyces litchfieldiae]|uniref:DUF4253 domain-containing protein n=1 Tax=Streptomyces litchfieldiae TaxID=3075543 RepID=A0ABU2MXC2_9ACTN|nr:DUF4253 domain-containing protein [Streptomyces sp. DSM 44938]MDT0346032.1 DUF4253 domain-containing protein [Streptomyces sp. DSM 44938]
MSLNLRLLSEAGLPSGRVITSGAGNGGVQALWLSDGAASGELWARLRAEHANSGLWPLLLDSWEPATEAFGPWATGELFRERMTSPDAHRPAELLAQWWSEFTAYDEEDDHLSLDQRMDITAPFGQDWPGLVPGRESPADPDDMAAAYAQVLTARQPHARLGLVAAAHGADALAAVGWSGPVNYDNDTGKYAAVVRDWERRFGARVVALGADTLHLSVAAPPTSAAEALPIAAEHFAFCPDNIWQGPHPQTLAAYADRIIDANSWEFWWD